MMQKFLRDVICTDNIDSAARFGYAKIQKAVEKAFGLDSLPIDWESPLKADLILVIDSDITSALPVWGLKFIEAKNKGAALVVAASIRDEACEKQQPLAQHKTGERDCPFERYHESDNR